MRTTAGSGIHGGCGGRLAERQGKEEGDAALGEVVGPDPTAVGAHDSLADGEPEPRPPSAGGGRPVELLEDAVFLSARQAGTAVGDLHGDRRLRGGHGYRDGAAGG